MSKKIKKLIRKTTQRLKWPVRWEEVPGGATLEIMSDHAGRHHTIYLPSENVREIEKLHELGHAWLCENVDPMFSTQYFEPNTPGILEVIQPASRSANDWFVDHWLWEIAPEEEKREIDEHAHLFAKAIAERREGTAEEMCGAALMFAQHTRYCGARYKTAGQLGEAMAAFLATDPGKPSAAAMTALVNRLLSIYSPWRVSLSTDQITGLPYWLVKNSALSGHP